jgi:hypothetical protein
LILAYQPIREKATATHVDSLQRKVGGERFARHWYELAEMHGKGYAQRAHWHP